MTSTITTDPSARAADGRPHRRDLYLTDPAQEDAQPWGYLALTSPVAAGPALDITAWTHHGTAWVTACGPLTQWTIGTLEVVMARLRPTSPNGVVLNLCALTDLDAAGVRCLVEAHHLTTKLGHPFAVVAAWTAEPCGSG